MSLIFALLFGFFTTSAVIVDRPELRVMFIFLAAIAFAGIGASFFTQKRAPVQKVASTPPSRIISGEREIREMNIGEGAFTVSWAMINYEDKFYLHGGYTVTEIIRGTSDMLIERHKDGYHVFSSTNGEKYESCNWIPWVGATKADLVPVAAIH